NAQFIAGDADDVDAPGSRQVLWIDQVDLRYQRGQFRPAMGQMCAGDERVRLTTTEACFETTQEGHHIVAVEAAKYVLNDTAHAVCRRSCLTKKGSSIGVGGRDLDVAAVVPDDLPDRKSTRLNST